MPKKKLTQERLKKLLHYDPDTGIFAWKVSRGTVKVGKITGYVDINGYTIIGVDHKIYTAHRLAWLFVYGYFPENDLDHIDRIRYHNWILNLREVSHQCNVRNSGNRKDNISGVKGVSWHKREKKWVAQIAVNEKQISIGGYSSFDNAACARLAGEQCLNWDGCDSSSPAFKHVQKMLNR